MPTLPTSFLAGYEPSADDYQAMLDLLNALSGMPAPTTSSATGTASTGAETLDTVLGTYQFTVPAAGASWRYEGCFQQYRISGTLGEQWGIHIRDGGASTPTSSSTLVASYNQEIPGTGGAGQTSGCVRGTWVPGAGVHTLGTFFVRIAGSGNCTPIAADSSSRELFARFQGFS